jgi:hydroxyquinol 1,2-dioxygenase
MPKFTTENLSEEVIDAMQGMDDSRLKEVMTTLINHLHSFVREVKPSDQEWMAAIQFLTDTGKMCSSSRQEFILLSDILGVTALKDALNNPHLDGTTDATVLGPFYRSGAPEVPQMTNIAGTIPGKPLLVQGTVSNQNGKPISGALLDIWQANGEGYYDVQLEELEGQMGLRGKLRTDGEGRYRFRSVKPSSYPIPHDGPVGKLLQKLGRHPYRPAHIHFMISADGYKPIVTQIFVNGDEYLESDAVFGVRDSLVVDFEKDDSTEEAAKYGLSAPFYKVQYNFVLKAL